MYYIDFLVELPLHTWVNFPLVILICNCIHFSSILTKDFCICNHKISWLLINKGIFFSYDVFIQLWYQGSVGLPEWIGKCSILFNYLEEFEENWYLFFKCSVEVISEAIWFCWEVFLLLVKFILLVTDLSRCYISFWVSSGNYFYNLSMSARLSN